MHATREGDTLERYHTTVEEVFDLLADAAQTRYPNPERENRGLCPAHGDTNNPGLVYRIADSGKLITHCFSQGCTPQDIADSIGVPLSAFFPDGGSGMVRPRPEYVEPSLLELLKALPLGMSLEEQEQAVFRCLESAYATGVTGNDTLDIEQPIRELATNRVMSYLWLWLQDGYDPDRHDWRELSDKTTGWLRDLNRQTRRHLKSSGNAIPRKD